MPDLVNLFPNANNLSLPDDNSWCQQDEAFLHYKRDVWKFLNNSFRRRRIERLRSMASPAMCYECVS